MRILLTGGAGYIGSHTALALADAGYVPVLLDNFSNSHPEVLNRLTRILGKPLPFVQGNVADSQVVEQVICEYAITAVVHFSAFKAVGESVQQPLKYYENNIGSLLGLITAMNKTHCKSIVFSSSCTVYGDPKKVPVTESMPTGYSSPYGHTKLIGEQILQTLVSFDAGWRAAVLRYFNPAGAHESGLIGEDPVGIPTNLMPYVAQVAIGHREKVQVFGGDYLTPDGTGVRDYIHVMDLAEGHVLSLRKLMQDGSHLVNLGTGKGSSVLEVIDTYSRVCGKPIRYEKVGRRPGDVAVAYADSSLAEEILNWRARRSLEDMCVSSWNWQCKNPRGYR